MLLFGGPQQLRLSCDRCHKRKQRCTRTAPSDENPCRRCKEAGEKCVFSPPLRLGRPSKRQKQEGKLEETSYRGQEGSFLAVSNQDLSGTTATETTASSTTTQDENISGLETSSPFSIDGMGEMETSSADQHELACTASLLNHNIVAKSFEVWPLPLDNYTDPTISVTTPGLFRGQSTIYNDETWSDLFDDKAHSEPPTSSHIDPLDPSLMMLPGASASDSAIGSIDHCPSDIAESPIMDPISMLSQIQLKLHGIQTRRPPHAAELQIVVNQTVQIAQKFMEVLNQILPPRTADSNNSMSTADAQQYDLTDFVPVQIGSLHTVVSPRLQIALLVQLISQHTEEIRHKTRQLATRVETRSNMDPSLNNIIGKDIRGEEEDLRDRLDSISERLKMHSQFQDHRSLDR
ncbi:hypothetical protein TGAM01_v206464 [Trichoderma gamsii]|uniref:Zn(2)-C6 fungal-type domain-containing protein n=1 Tax=Trichoderma gamsii TaxID=398673 RepID=A0A2P4ZJS8_9HYPO|nr:hypothetical protein TGAM01_v206464 [Trichoderma gamsii]PON24534.1 hypothetical protein TGAM01_v206464 [Trichoderma gamsii]